jgi:hypothetical protein
MNEDRHTINMVKQLLDESAQRVPPHVQQRLDDAIAKTLLAHASRAAVSSPAKSKPTAAEGLGLLGIVDALTSWFNKPALSLAVSSLCVVAAVSGVVKFGLDYKSATDTETADLDAAILSDDLPTDAYLDSGFIHYFKRKPKEPESALPSDDSIDQWMQAAPVDQTSI